MILTLAQGWWWKGLGESMLLLLVLHCITSKIVKLNLLLDVISLKIKMLVKLHQGTLIMLSNCQPLWENNGKLLNVILNVSYIKIMRLVD
jgi:hypothetical protein